MKLEQTVQGLKPRLTVGVGERLTSGHLFTVGARVVVVGIGKGPTEAFGQRPAKRALARTGHAHDQHGPSFCGLSPHCTLHSPITRRPPELACSNRGEAVRCRRSLTDMIAQTRGERFGSGCCSCGFYNFCPLITPSSRAHSPRAKKGHRMLVSFLHGLKTSDRSGQIASSSSKSGFSSNRAMCRTNRPPSAPSIRR